MAASNNSVARQAALRIKNKHREKWHGMA